VAAASALLAVQWLDLGMDRLRSDALVFFADPIGADRCGDELRVAQPPLHQVEQNRCTGRNHYVVEWSRLVFGTSVGAARSVGVRTEG
jgi:hypothetical protein